jgi:hypothetical protein
MQVIDQFARHSEREIHPCNPGSSQVTETLESFKVRDVLEPVKKKSAIFNLADRAGYRL